MDLRARLGTYSNSGRSLRSTHVRVRTAGLRPAEAAARTAFARPIFTRCPLRNRTATALLIGQPSARGRLRAAGRAATEFTDDHSAKIGGCGQLRFHSEPHIQNSELRVWVAVCEGRAGADANCGPPLPGSCGPPIAARLILLAACGCRRLSRRICSGSLAGYC